MRDVWLLALGMILQVTLESFLLFPLTIVERIATGNTCRQVCDLAKCMICMSMTATTLAKHLSRNGFTACDIFHKEFNLGFHVPKKDQCDFCHKYENADNVAKSEMQSQMIEHMNNKRLSRQLKDEEKVRGQTDSTINVSCFDLQQVLTTPQTAVIILPAILQKKIGNL